MVNFELGEISNQNPEWESEVYEILSLSAPCQGLQRRQKNKGVLLL